MTTAVPGPRQEAPPAPPALEVKDLHAGYGRVEVLHGVGLVVPPSGIVAVLGPNGAGKSTLLRVISGRAAPTSGSVRVRGVDVTGAAAERLARAGLCSVPEGRGVFPNLTVAENLRMWTHRPGVHRDQVEQAAYGRFPTLARRRRQLAGTLSGGEQQMLAMSRALTTSPDVLLLDEVSMGLAPVVAAEVFALVVAVAEQGTPVLLVEQFARTALEVADHVVFMTSGRVRASGAPDEVRDLVLDTYLAGHHPSPSREPDPSPTTIPAPR